MHYPALQITTRSKLSSVCWNSYVKSQLITSDYSGLIQLWDASTAAEAAQYDEHARRVWSVDFSTTDPMRFLRWVGGRAGGWVGGQGFGGGMQDRKGSALPCSSMDGPRMQRALCGVSCCSKCLC